MREKKHKIIKWIVVNLVAAPLVLLGVFTGYSHFKTGMYSFESWEIVWPAMVSTLIAVFGTLVTSYVFLKDALDRTIDEKPYYKK